MTEKPRCSIEGCERASRARGWCLAHYRKWQRHGDPLAGVRPSWRRWTDEENRQLLAAVPPRGIRVPRGVLIDFALMFERSPSAVRTRLCFLRRRQWEAERAAVLVSV